MIGHEEDLYIPSQIRQLESFVFDEGLVSAEDLMERAGRSAFAALMAEWPETQSVLIICGKGNNAGDGLVLAREAAFRGLEVYIYDLFSYTALSPLAKKNHDNLKSCPVNWVASETSFKQAAQHVDVVVDAMLGIGLKGDVKQPFESVIDYINHLDDKKILAMDLPSGLDAENGRLHGIAIKADLTVTFLGLKQGMFTHRAPSYCGKVLCDDLDLPADCYRQLSPSANLLTWKQIKANLPKRQRDAHKGNYGHVLVIGGDYGMGGAVRLAAEAAMRVGAGLVSVATRPEHVNIVSGARPEIMCHEVKDASDLDRLLAACSVVVIGPGLGQTDWALNLFERVMKSVKPKVLDADCLNLLSQHPIRGERWILTPHPGEAARLLNTSTEEVQQDRFAAVTEIQQCYGGVAVLKGAGTIIKSDDPVPAVCRAGNPGMASGGMGDILSGVIGGLLAQGLDVFEAAEVGVFVHAVAADRAVEEGGERGLLATDLLPHLRNLVNPN